MSGHDVMISYSSKEKREAYLVRDVLTDNGISVWMAPDSIPGGSNYTIEIPDAISSCKLMVLILSKNSQASGWVSQEVATALEEEKRIIPFAIDNSEITDAFNVYISESQRIDAYHKLTEGLMELVTDIYVFLGREVPEQRKKDINRRMLKYYKGRIILAISAVLLFAAICVVGIYAIIGPEKPVSRFSGSELSGEDKNISWKYDEPTKTLTIRGEGEMGEYSIYDDLADYNKDAPWLLFRDEAETVIVEDGITNIGRGAFRTFSAVTDIQLPDSVTSIDSYAFMNCGMMRTIDLPDGVESIGNRAFSGCKLLMELELPISLEELGNNVFLDTALMGVTVSEENKFFIADANCLYNKEKTKLYRCFPTTQAGSYTMPDTVTEMAEGAFENDTNLVLLKLSDHLTEIPNYAFYGCSNLKRMPLPDGIVRIGDNAFCDCPMFELSETPHSLKEIGEYAFSNCSSLSHVTISSPVKSIPEGSFSVCDFLVDIRLPDTLTVIGDDAFFLCGMLEDVYIPESVSVISDTAFEGCDALKVIHGKKGSYAEEFAEEIGVDFIADEE